jgi:chromate transporter
VDACDASTPPSLLAVLVAWGRIGCVGFGGPPAHIALLRALVVDDERWIDDRDFDDAVAACNLLPGPASTQLAIFLAWRTAGPLGALVGGLAFIVPGLVLVLGLSAVFFAASAPVWVLGASAGAGAVVAAVALRAGSELVGPSWRRAASRWRWVLYGCLGALAAATVGPWIVLVLLACGAVELAVRHPRGGRLEAHAGPLVAGVAAAGAVGGFFALAWVAFKVGALSYGGGFVIIPLMQGDAVHRYHWMTSSQFLDAIALGQVTPGPVTHTVAAVGFAAAGLLGGLYAACIAFLPSFAFVLAGAPHFDRLRHDERARAFLDGAGPAAIGAILGVAVPLALSLHHAWQWALLGIGAVVLLGFRRPVVTTLLAAAAVGIVASPLGAPVR